MINEQIFPFFSSSNLHIFYPELIKVLSCSLENNLIIHSAYYTFDIQDREDVGIFLYSKRFSFMMNGFKSCPDNVFQDKRKTINFYPGFQITLDESIMIFCCFDWSTLLQHIVTTFAAFKNLWKFYKCQLWST